MKKKFYCVALDSDMLINLSKFNDPSFDQSCFGEHERKNLELINELNLKGELDFIVLPLVFGEMFPTGKVMKFIDERCIVVEINNDVMDEHINKTEELATKYTSSRVNDRPVMNELFNASLRKRIPTNDAFIMAEATIMNLCLLTNNKIDYINFPNEFIPQRAWEIEKINQDNGYHTESNTPRPISPEYLYNKMSKNEDLELTELNEDNRGTYFELE